MTIAITPFEGLCGFRPLAEIAHFLTTIPSLRNLIGDLAAKTFEETIKGQETSSDPKALESNKKALKEAFTALMSASNDDIASAAKQLVASAEKEGEHFAGGGGPSNEGKELAELVLRSNSQFPADLGLFVLFFLNYVKLQPGEAMFLKADDIHAYLSGGASFFPHLKATIKFFYSELANSFFQILSSAWPLPTMSSVPALHLSIKISAHSPPC